MQITDRLGYGIAQAEHPLWLGQTPAGWGDAVRTVDPNEAQDAASLIAAAGLAWTVEQCPLEAVLATGEDGHPTARATVPRHVANVRSDTGAVLGVVGEGYEPLQNRAAFAFCDDITDSGRAHWIGAGLTRGGARVHALMRLDRDVRIGGAEGEEVLPLLCFRNGHDGGLAVTVSVAPFRLACLNGMLLPLPNAQRVWKARHTAHVQARLADARRTLGIAWRYYDELEEWGGRLICERIGEGEFERFLSRLVPLPEPKPDRSEGGRAVRNAERVREAIRTAYRAAPDLADIRGTRWGALQAVAAYVDHTQPTRQTAGRTHAEARFERATEPAPLKDRALELLTEGGIRP
jgi:phage/plasmid-like protein (TIGR03299 family)